jgi:hypothetical protein
LLVGASLALGACGGFCGTSSSSTASIVGYWSFKGGVVHVQATDSGYQGVITQKPTDGACAEQVGYVLLKLVGGANHYTGSEEWWEDGSCARMYSDTATIDVSGSSARLCSKDPFPDAGETECVTMDRQAGSA